MCRRDLTSDDTDQPWIEESALPTAITDMFHGNSVPDAKYESIAGVAN